MTNAHYSIRLATAADLPALARLHALAFPHEPWDVAALAGMLATPGTAALTAGALTSSGGATGFVLSRVVLDEAEILTICVGEAARRRGVGAALLQAARDAAAADGAASLYLEAAADNVSALALYRSAGFAEVGRRRGYYRRGAEKIDALVMRLAPLSHI